MSYLTNPYRYGGVKQISQENFDDGMSLQKDGTDAYGYTFQTGHELIGKTVTSVWFYIKAGYGAITSGRIASFCGQDYVSASGNVEIGSFPASNLSTSDWYWYEFTGTNTPTVLVDDVIWIQFSVVADQRCEVKSYQNAPVYVPSPPANFWGNNSGTGLPSSNTLGTVDAGATIVNYDLYGATIGVAPPADSAPYFHPLRIKIDYS